MTFHSALVLMLAEWPRLGLCSGLERECLMTGEGSVAAGQANYGVEQEVEGFEPPVLMASRQNKPIILVGEGQDFSHTSLAMHSAMMLNGPVIVAFPSLLISRYRMNRWWWSLNNSHL